MSRPMTRTPWGDSELLREQKLNPRAALPPEAVRKNQRERIFGAMVATMAEKGYEASSVADLVELSGCSRKSFYELFADKQACFLATLEAILEDAGGIIARRYDGKGSALAAYIELIVAQPAASRICFVEVYAGGAEAIGVMDRAVADVERLFERAFEARDGEASMPAEIVAAIVGGLRKVIHTRLRRGREGELSALVPELWAWGIGYETPPKRLRRRARVDSAAPARRYRPEDPAERIIRAATEVVAEEGYQATTVGKIARAASISLSTFYKHFESKEEAVLAALDAGQAQLLAATLPAFRRTREWPAAVRAAAEAMFAFLAAEPAFARLVAVEVYSVGERALELRDVDLEVLAGLLEPGYRLFPDTPPIAAEAIGGAIYALVDSQVRKGGAEGLREVAPLATYITLAPFLGAAEACAVARGRS
jgi:AcrR family transcriptional regulator